MNGQKLNMKEIFREVENTKEDKSITVKKRGTRRNKSAGHQYEYNIRDEHRKLGFLHVVTCIGESKTRDAQKIDLMNKDEHINGRLPYNIQCKATCEIVDYVKIFNGYTKRSKLKRSGQYVTVHVPGMPVIPGIVNVIFHKKTKKVIYKTKGEDHAGKEMFVTEGEFVITTKSDWLQMVKELKRLKETYEPC